MSRTPLTDQQKIDMLKAVAINFLAVMSRYGQWEDGCFYYNRTSASELQGTILDAKAALALIGKA